MRSLTSLTAVGLVLLAAMAVTVSATGHIQSNLHAAHDAARKHHLSLLRQHLGTAHRGFKQQQNVVARTFGALQSNVTSNSTNTTAAPTTTAAPQSTAAGAFCLQQQENMTARLRARCGSVDDIVTLVDPSNTTQQATNAINSFCSSTCQDEVNSIRREMASCIDDDVRGLFDVITLSCHRIDGTVCALKIRGFDRLECDSLSEGECRSSNKSCSWTRNLEGSMSCEATPTQAVLQEICTPCLDKYMLLFGRLSGDDVQRTLIASKELMCSKSGNRFCLPIFNGVDSRVFELDNSNTMSLDAINANITSACSDGDAARCLTKIGLATSKSFRIINDNSFRNCVAGSRGSTGDCLNVWVTLERAAVQVENVLPFLCATNDENVRCMPEFHAYLRTPCQRSIGSDRVCNETCAQGLTNFTARARCCLHKYHKISAEIIDPARLPRYDGSARPTAGNLTWENHPLFDAATVCANASGFNESLIRGISMANCRGATNVARKEIQLRGLLWDSISNNTEFRQKLVASLRADVAQAIGCSMDQILNMTLSIDTAQALNASVRARQQSSGASAGTKASFAISGDSDTQATANGNAFESGRNTLTLPLTAGAIQEECATCVAAPTAAPGQTPAPFSLSDLFASLTGADQSITSSSTTPSPGGLDTSASPVVVAWLAVVLSALVIFFVAA